MLETLGLISLSIASLGILGTTFAFPLLAAVFSKLRERNTQRTIAIQTEEAALSRNQILIAIPVAPMSSEELAITLNTVRTALELAPRNLDCIVQVILDGADSENREVLKKYPEILATEQPRSQGKWSVIKSIKGRSANWIMCLDVGTILPFDFFAKINPYLQNQNYSALYPSYEPAKGFISQCLWTLERVLKDLENYAGGPIAAHGACMLYRAEIFRNALLSLDEVHYRNDDVVLPLAIRLLSSHIKTKYLSDIRVHDVVVCPLTEKETFARRQRMALGNMQWMQDLFPLTIKKDVVIMLLSCRRISRLFWGYWLLSIIVGVSTLLLPMISAAVLAVILILLCISNLPQLRDALRASVESPRWLMSSHLSVRWK